MATFNESLSGPSFRGNGHVGINRLPKGRLGDRFDLWASKDYMASNRAGSPGTLYFKLCLAQLFQYLFLESELQGRADFSLLQGRREVSTPWGPISVSQAPSGEGEKEEARAGERPDILVTSPAECFFVRRDCRLRRARGILEELYTCGFVLRDGRKLPGLLSWAKFSLVRCDIGWIPCVSFTVPTDILEAMFDADTIAAWHING